MIRTPKASPPSSSSSWPWIATAARAAETSITLKAGVLRPVRRGLPRRLWRRAGFGVELAVPIAGPLQGLGGGRDLRQAGLLPVSRRTTKIRIIPLYAGLRAEFGKTGVRPYVGAAAAYFLFNEENPLGTVERERARLSGPGRFLHRLGEARSGSTSSPAIGPAP